MAQSVWTGGSHHTGLAALPHENIHHQKITTDTTEFKYYEVDKKGHMTMNKLYLDPFMNMYNGEIISFRISKIASFKNVADALEEAIERTADCPY